MTTPADLVVHGSVYTGDAVRSWARGIAVRGDRIVALGSPPELRGLVVPSTRVGEAGDRLVTAGVQDDRVHAPAHGLR